MNYVEITKFPALEYAANEAFNTLCTNLSYCGTEIKTVMITSRYASEGKSYIGMNLMRTLASLGKRVVLVDTDLRCSGISGMFRLRFSKGKSQGITDYLAGMCELQDVLYATNIADAYMVPVGYGAVNSLQLLASPRLADLMSYLAERFDVVLVDTPPAGLLADAIEIAKYCDGALVVVSYNRGKRQDIADVVKMIGQTSCRVLGAVLNNVEFGSYSNRKYYFRSERYASYYSKYSSKYSGYAKYTKGYSGSTTRKKRYGGDETNHSS